MFNKVLIANRGEIACRVMQTCDEMDIATVAVFSDADRFAPHVLMADEAVHIGPAEAKESYLNIDKIIAAAQATGAEAIHPGYGFLSENTQFAQACADNNIVFIGPSVETIEKMGSKLAAKQIMEAAGVPLVPGYHGNNQDVDLLAAEAKKIEFPLMIKAAAGGGGKGMRIVHREEDFLESLESAKRESMNAFGDDKVILERFVQKPRHIEFQIFADTHGNTIHLYERECSIQRRYQKIIEETPSPFLSDEGREQMGAAAVAAAQAVDYTNAGTVEFIVDDQGRFYFMEMNTRLQVEHPVTEMITQQDLVEWQLRIAAGQELPLQQSDIPRFGHSIEARVYAEDANNNFMPSTGTISTFAPSEFARCDTGVQEGSVITPHYDPMISKLIVHAENREEAIAQMHAVLNDTAILGVTNNLPLLRKIIANDDFINGDIDTTYIDQHINTLIKTEDLPDVVMLAKAIHSLMLKQDSTHDDNPWASSDAWQANQQGKHRYLYSAPNGVAQLIELKGWDTRYDVQIEDQSLPIQVTAYGPEVLEFQLGSSDSSNNFSFTIHSDGTLSQVSIQNQAYLIEEQDRFPVNLSELSDATPGAPMPGRIVKVFVNEGDSVAEGDALLVMEGMKMEISINAKVSGTVEKILYQVGDMVEAEVPLVEIV